MRPVLTASIALALAAMAGGAAHATAQQGDAPAPRTAAEANRAAVPGEPTRTVERSEDPTQPDRVTVTYPGNLTPPPPSALNRDYPPCSATVQDGCRNPGESGPDESETAGPQRGAGPSQKED